MNAGLLVGIIAGLLVGCVAMPAAPMPPQPAAPTAGPAEPPAVILAKEDLAQRLGIPLADIGAALSTLPCDHMPTAADWQQLSAQWQRDLDARIEQLTQLRDQLTGCIGCGCLSMQDCPLRNPSDELGEQGAGARLLETD